MTNVANDDRPPEFDARLMSYYPGLRQLAKRYVKGSEGQNDLVTDTIAYCLQSWRNFREDGGFWSWLAWSMRGVAKNQRDARGRRIETIEDPDGVYADTIRVPAIQVESVYALDVIRMMNPKVGDMLLRRAMGDTLQEIAATAGLCDERVRQLTHREQRRLAKVAA